MTQKLQLFISLPFLAIVFTVPLVQAALELKEDETPVIAELFTQMPDEENLRAFEKDLEDASFFEEKLRPVAQLLSYVLTRDMGIKAIEARKGWLFYAPDVRYTYEPYYATSRALWPEGRDPVSIVEDFRDQLARFGAHLLVVPVPTKPSIYPDKLSPLCEAQAEVAQNTSRFIAELERRGLDVLDLRPSLQAARAQAEPQPIYMLTDTHWNRLGLLAAAKAVAQRIRSLPGLELQGAADRYATKRVTVSRQGDIATMTQIPYIEKLVEAEAVEVDQVLERATLALYADDPSSPVLVLGDSFSRIFQTDEPGSAGFIALLARELGMPVSSIVNDGGASTLVRQELARNLSSLNAKKIVVWEFVERDIRFGMRGWQEVRLLP
ncbi:MAG: hypothetical protein MUC50_00755 [Myxococcota bacterium]|jgi:hypothetical protein|nr:hypothetical protein [Myxococcota bacterium]